MLCIIVYLYSNYIIYWKSLRPFDDLTYISIIYCGVYAMIAVPVDFFHFHYLYPPRLLSCQNASHIDHPDIREFDCASDRQRKRHTQYNDNNNNMCIPTEENIPWRCVQGIRAAAEAAKDYTKLDSTLIVYIVYI